MLLRGLISCGLLAGVLGVTLVPAPGSHAGAPPAKAFFRDPFLSQVKLSPDGDRLAALITRAGRETLIVRSLADATLVPVARNEESARRIVRIEWANADRLLFSLETRPQWALGRYRRSTQLWALNRDGADKQHLGETWPVQEFSQYQTNWIGILPENKDRILVNHAEANLVGTTPRQVLVKGGGARPALATLAGAERWHADRFGRVRAATMGGSDSDRYELHARLDDEGPLKAVSSFDPNAESGLLFGAFGEQPAELYVIERTPDGRDSVRSYDLATKTLGPKVFSHTEVDAAGVALDHRGRAVGVDYILDGRERDYFDGAAEREQRGLDAALPGTTNRIVSASADGGRKVIEASSATSAPHYYLLDREAMSLEVLFATYPELDGVELAKTRAFEFKARDGLQLHAYVTTPRDYETGRLPTIVATLERPQGRALLGFQPLPQFLASRGFAVLQVNFRGSRGYGKPFELAGRGQWGRGIQDDLEDGLRSLAEQGIADLDRVGIFGQGFGGYSALMGVIRTPDLYRASASYGAPTDLLTLLRDDQHPRGPWSYELDHHVAAWGDRTQLIALSPYDQVEKIDVPILLGHGALDSAVDVKHAKRLHRGMLDSVRRSEIHVYPNERSSLELDQNRIRFYERVARFFAQHLVPSSPP